jgi:zinc protease
MSVISIFYRHRIPLLILSLWLTTVLLLNDYSAYSQLNAASKINNIHNTYNEVVREKTTPSTVTENVQKTVLENGLTVLTKEVHTAPVVTVQVWYKVGSRNEERGLNGIAHQLEHMMFKGTNNRPIQFGRLFSALGSDSNAFTSFDQTAYYGTVERDKLKALLVLEADRMQNALIDTEKLNSEKRVVISELQGYENSSEYRLNRAVMQAMYPNHPYGLPVGGNKVDVEKFTAEQVQKYYRNFYHPENAVVVIVGDFRTQTTIATVKGIFEKIPSLQQDDRLKTAKIAIKPQNTKSHNPIILQEPGAAALLKAVYPLPGINHPDIVALDIMDYILSEGRNSRLYRALIDSGLASDVSASVASLLEAGWYHIDVTASPKQKLPRIDTVLQNAIAKLIQKGVTQEEIKRAKAQLSAAMILGNRDITNQAMQLGNDQIIAGDYRFIDHYLNAIHQVTPQDVQRVANTYLQPQALTVGYFQPTQAPINTKSISKANSTQTTENFSSGSVNLAEVKKYLPAIDSNSDSASRTLPQQITLANGMRVLLLSDRSTPTVTLCAYFKAGSEFDPQHQAGLASMVAETLMSGTKTKDVLTLAKALEDKGSHLDFEISREGVRAQGSSLASDLPILLNTLGESVRNPSFPSKEVELVRQQALSGLNQDLDDPDEVARRTFVQSVYPKTHPLHILPTTESIKRVTRADITSFQAKHYRPDTTILALVGDFNSAQVRSLLETEFGNWQVKGEAPAAYYPAVVMPESPININSVLPGKAQVITYMGSAAINRQDPRYYSALVLNQILGGDTLSSRLGAEVRDRQGLTYGIYSNFLAGKNSGTFLIEMQTSPEDVTKAIASTRKLLGEMHKTGVTKEEVETAKRTAISNYIVSLTNPEELTYRILMNEVYGLDDNELRSFTTKIQSVTLEQVNQAARELLHPDKIVVATAGPAVVAGQR